MKILDVMKKYISNPMVLCVLGISTVGVPLGLLGPVTVILLEKQHTPTWLTGLFVTMSYITIFLFSSLSGKLIRKHGVRYVFILGCLLMLVASVGLFEVNNIPILFVARALMGVGITMAFVSTEVMVNVLSTDEKRNKNISIYILTFSVGIAIGSLLIWTVNIAYWVPYLIGTIIIMLVLIFEYIYLPNSDSEKSSDEQKSNFRFIDLPLIGVVTAILYGFFESSLTVILPVYGLRCGFSQNETSMLISSFVIGNIVVLYFISKYFNKKSKLYYIFLLKFLITCFLILPMLIINPYGQLPILFLLGGFVPALYTFGLTYTMECVEKQHIAVANGYFATCYGIGTLAGPLLGSKLLDVNNYYAYWTFAAILSFILALVTYFTKKNVN